MKNNIEQYRKAENLTIRELAKKAGVGFGGLCDIQNGKTCPTIETAYKISSALNKTVYQVFPKEES